MCGRYTITVTLEELESMFRLGPLDNPNYRPRYNVAPGQMIPAILAHEGKNRLGELRWGLLPSWSQGEPSGRPLINARSESVHEKPAFRELLRTRRCLIPADGFYEWQTLDGGAKQPMRIVRKDRQPFAMAGLYELRQAEDGQRQSVLLWR